MSTQTPELIIHATPDATAVEPSAHVSQGGGGSMPGFKGSPASTGAARRQTRARETRNLFNSVPPMVEVVDDDERLPVVSIQFTTDETCELERYCAFVSQGDLISAARMCREKLLRAADGQPAARWTKDRALVHMVGGDYEAALDLLASRYQTALDVGGAFAGRYETSFGQVYNRLRQFDRALEHFTAGRICAEDAGDHLQCARTDVSTGRCLVSARRPEDSHSLFDRAQLIAESYADTLLCGEIDESRALAFEAQGLFRQARKMAAHSIYLLEGTPYTAALLESRATYERLLGESEQRGQA